MEKSTNRNSYTTDSNNFLICHKLICASRTTVLLSVGFYRFHSCSVRFKSRTPILCLLYSADCPKQAFPIIIVLFEQRCIGSGNWTWFNCSNFPDCMPQTIANHRWLVFRMLPNFSNLCRPVADCDRTS